MNKNKNSKILLVLSILLLFLIIGSASATDETSNETVSTTTNDGVDTLTTDDSSVDEKSVSAVDNTNDILGSTINVNNSNPLKTEDILSSEDQSEKVVSNFTELKETISNNSISKIKLNNNISITSTLTLHSNLIIDGNGFTFTQATTGNLISFTDQANSYNITFINCNFKNLVNTDNNNYAPIQLFSNNCSNYSIINCNFTNNHGRIGIVDSAVNNITVINCCFSNNVVGLTAGAMRFRASNNASVINCKFINNTAGTGNRGNGGALEFYASYSQIDNCVFINNTLKSSITVSAGAGGAINLIQGAKNITITNCRFIGNNNTNGIGGAIGTLTAQNTGVSIIGCSFENNSAKNGGALYFNGKDSIISNSNFTGNFASGSGGAIYTAATGTSIKKCNFTGNNASNGADLAKGAGGQIEVDFYSSYYYVCADNEGSGRSISSGDGLSPDFAVPWKALLEASSFLVPGKELRITGEISNWATKVIDVKDLVFTIANTGDGFKDIDHTLFNVQSDGVTFDGLSFNNCSDVLRITGDKCSVVNCNFIDNSGTGDGSCIYLSGDNFKLVNSIFDSNTAIGKGTVYVTGTDSSCIYDSTFINNKAYAGGAIYYNGEIFYYVDQNTRMKFNNNEATGLYGQEKEDQKNISDVQARTMLSNVYVTVTGQGYDGTETNPMNLSTAFKAVTPNGIIHFIDNENGNYIYPTYHQFDLNKPNITFIGQKGVTTFTNVSIITTSQANDIKIYNLIFRDYAGTVMINKASGCIAENCSFINNKDSLVSCIILEDNANDCKIINCDFNNNNATVIDVSNNNTLIKNSRFNGNINSTSGIIVYESNLTGTSINECIFTDNNASIATVYSLSPLTIVGSSFNDDSKYSVWANDTLTVSDSNFTGKVRVVSGSSFDNVSFNNAGLIIESGDLILHNSSFKHSSMNINGDVNIDNDEKILGNDFTITVADSVVVKAKILYVAPEGNKCGFYSGDRVTLDYAVEHILDDGKIYLLSSNQYVTNELQIKNNITIIGNNSYIKRNNNNKSLFNNT